MNESGLAIDVASKTVVLFGTNFIHNLMNYAPGTYTLSDFNRIATTIVRHSGAHYGAYLDGETDDEWVLATGDLEAAKVLTSYLQDPAAEVSLIDVTYEIKPKVSKPCLH